MTDKGYVQNHTFFLPPKSNADEIIDCIKLLNDRLIGTPISELVEKVEALQPIIKEHVVSHDILYQTIMETLMKLATDRLTTYGGEELFNNPEFQNDSSKLQKVMKMLANASNFKDLDKDEDFDDGVSNLHIGEEIGDDDLSLLTTKLNIGDNNTKICLVGPKRMDYDAAMSALEYLSKMLSKYFDDKKNNGGNNDA